MATVRLIYFSRYQIDPANGTMISQLNAILDTANRQNQAKGISGALIFDAEWFAQVLEGERDAVWSLFKSIERDKHHTDVMLVEMTSVTERHFVRWWMGCAERNARNAAIFAPHLRNGRFRPGEMAASDLLSLFIDLEKSSLSREMAA